MERTEICRNCGHRAVCKMYDPMEQDACCVHFKMEDKFWVLQETPDGTWDRRKDPYMIVELPEEKDYEHLKKLIDRNNAAKVKIKKCPLSHDGVMYFTRCPACGERLRADDSLENIRRSAQKFCEECGQRLDWSEDDE